MTELQISLIQLVNTISLNLEYNYIMFGLNGTNGHYTQLLAMEICEEKKNEKRTAITFKK